MVRRTRIVLVFVTVAAAVSGAALAPAAGDNRITGSSAKLSYTADGVPYVRSGPECKAGKLGAKQAHARPDASDY
jgi:hypothetical protein